MLSGFYNISKNKSKLYENNDKMPGGGEEMKVYCCKVLT